MQPEDQQRKIPKGERVYVKANVIAEIYDTDESTIYKWAKCGKIPCEEIEGIRRFHLPSVRQKLEGLYRISEDDKELGIFC
jgi:hypothetical protein